ncbi:molybdopterin-guanine dinucleotide biosynthesis protein A [Dyadobacter jejuensis]|uniref:Molybdopterin-guanine dinucleotide biosynthesis protein A n=1 Tax=Dyadobacter jejuensis TaxID=1082580 RepID=A0A316ALB7_9BACT|nr:molybdenum cofactor guanylyltransferase [Dyadobacter jejuensis]PWJ58312.1 molybdopterin-guanine dinucleotide biosynthesis protein A [Dyadobacter jejuensis]
MNTPSISEGPHTPISPLLGLVACGGLSSRMKQDKSGLVYHQKCQRQHVFDILQKCCDTVYYSCNEAQKSKFEIEAPVVVDAPEYQNHGPIAAVLTAYRHFPDYSILLVGCDYPYLTLQDLENFIDFTKRNESPAAFYNDQGFYEPLLGYYPSSFYDKAVKQEQKGLYSLQRLLAQNSARQYRPLNPQIMTSIDTPEGFERVRSILKSL